VALGGAHARPAGPAAANAHHQHRGARLSGAASCRIALLFGSFRGGGVGTSFLRLADALLARGHEVDLVVGRERRDLAHMVPTAARVVVLDRGLAMDTYARALRADHRILPALLDAMRSRRQPSGKLRHLASFASYLRRDRPDGVIAATTPLNLIAFWARRIAGSTAPLVMSEHNRFAVERDDGSRGWRYDCPPALVHHAYAEADALVGVSDGVADEMAAFAGIPRERIVTVYNPVTGPLLTERAAASLDHPWLQPGQPPVILGVGMLKPQKDFATLIHAFALLRAWREARLVILGDVRGDAKDMACKAELHALPEALGVAADVQFPGFVDNPQAWMARSACFVLSSRWEGLPTVLIEALGCGCPVISTDCPSGPSEILAGGRYGRLVPIADPAAMADAIATTLVAPPERATQLARAKLFSAARAADHYIELLFGAERRP
jgi:glycosyltransferase involved in cell wall biosynthesis